MRGSDYQILTQTLSDRYEILSTLGRGATSTVYLARHLKLKTLRAIKSIPKQSAPSSFPSEAVLLKTLNYPTIPILYDIEEDEYFFYLVEEYAEGESLEAFMLHQSIISEPFILQLGIQLCDLFTYLHTLTPDFVLYQDLKPEHIIVCGNQIKLVDFGCATFSKDLRNNFQFYGTKDYAAPEVQSGMSLSAASDLYSLGKVLSFLTNYCSPPCSSTLTRIIQKATAVSVADRYQTATQLKDALCGLSPDTCQTHLLRTIGIISSGLGVGATHLAVSTVSVLNKNGYSCYYEEKNNSHSLSSMAQVNSHFVEQDGIVNYQYFRAFPHYGESILLPSFPQGIHVKDYGVYQNQEIELEPDEILFFVMGSRAWEMEHAYAIGEQLQYRKNLVFLCNYGDTKAARHFARHFHQKVYCFPLDADPFCVTPQKEKLLLEILTLKGGKHTFFRKKGIPSPTLPSDFLE